jgi:tetratricopeptide (TPR) repeat protein
MSFESRRAKEWLTRGIEAYGNREFEEAADCCEKAVEIEPNSADAHLALGAVRFTLYLRGCFEKLTFSSKGNSLTWEEFERLRDLEKVLRAEQNATNGPLAEKSLKRANELDPQSKLAAEYLSSFYFHWKDPANENNDRAREATFWLDRLIEIDPKNKYAASHGVTLLLMKARRLLPHFGQFPFVPEPDLASRRAEIAPLLAKARQYLERALTLRREQGVEAHYLSQLTSLELYLTDPEMGSRKYREHMDAQFRKHLPPEEAGEEGSASASITFTLSPEAIAEDLERPFPPNPWRIPVR